MVNINSGFLRLAICIFGTCCIVTACKTIQQKSSSTETNTSSSLRKGFTITQDSIKPYVYWYWISDNISKEGITRDLEAMAKVGIGEAFIGNIGLETVPYGTVKVLSDEWWQLTRFAITEGQRLGVNIGMFNTPGWSQSGGPWVKPGEAMRYMVASEVTIEGGKKVSIKLPAAKDTMQNLAVIAFPVPKTPEQKIADFKPVVHLSSNQKNGGFLADNNLDTKVEFNDLVKKEGLTVDFDVEKEFTARSLVIYPDEIPFSATVELQIFTNGAYSSVVKSLVDRSNPMVAVGPIVYGPVSVALPEIRSKKFRFIFTNVTSPDGQKKIGGLKEIVLSSTPKIENYIEKQMGKMLQIPELVWNQYLWKDQASSGTKDMLVNANDVIDISEHLDKNGILNWDAPAGRWIVRRIGLTPTGTRNSPASPEATGFEVDKMNRDYLKKHFDAYVGKILTDLPGEERRSFKHVVIDSYEMGPQNWTEGLASDFKKTFGYDPIRWLPVLDGTIVNSITESNRFLWDLRRLIADRIAKDYVGGLRDISNKNGLRLWLENYGHWGFPSEFLLYGGQTNDIAGEFWVEGTLGNVECRAASSAAHIYGINSIFAESYTASGKEYERYPGYLKKRGDWSFTEGINHVLLHVYIHQPYEDKNPGMNAWFGTEFNRKNTWFNQSKTWIDYQRRCMYLLQQGKPVNDVCYFIGEDAPKLAGARNPELPAGYSYDYINADVIFNRLFVQDGKLMLPDGMSYKMMVLPPLETITPELLKRIKQLVNDGAVILGPKPNRSPSLKNYPMADSLVKSLADELWGNANTDDNIMHAFGKGLVMMNVTMEDALGHLNVYKDYDVPEGKPLLLTHRKTDGKDIYFVTNQSDEKVQATITFRVNGKQPELWDANHGSSRKLRNFSSAENGTKVPLQFEPAESYFIVFENEGKPELNSNNFPEGEIVQEINTAWTVSFDQKMRGPTGNITFSSLQDWSLNTNDSIKYFSGTAFYTNTFKAVKPGEGERIMLQLGDVKNMARVKINGKAAGGVWSAPWQIDISDFVLDKINTIEVEVVNLWVNRMIGDSKLPVEKRPTWVANNYFAPGNPLQPSGLLGPVTIKRIKY